MREHFFATFNLVESSTNWVSKRVETRLSKALKTFSRYIVREQFPLRLRRRRRRERRRQLVWRARDGRIYERPMPRGINPWAHSLARDCTFRFGERGGRRKRRRRRRRRRRRIGYVRAGGRHLARRSCAETPQAAFRRSRPPP